MTLQMFEPFRRLEEFDRVIDGFVAQHASRTPAGRQAESVWRPAADFAAEPDAYRVWVDLPGVRKEDVDVSLDEGVLKVRAQRTPHTNSGAETAAQRLLLSEIPTGTFERAFRMPKDADAAQVSATLHDGVLELRVAKQKQAQPRKIDVTNA